MTKSKSKRKNKKEVGSNFEPLGNRVGRPSPWESMNPAPAPSLNVPAIQNLLGGLLGGMQAGMLGNAGGMQGMGGLGNQPNKADSSAPMGSNGLALPPMQQTDVAQAANAVPQCDPSEAAEHLEMWKKYNEQLPLMMSNNNKNVTFPIPDVMENYKPKHAEMVCNVCHTLTYKNYEKFLTDHLMTDKHKAVMEKQCKANIVLDRLTNLDCDISELSESLYGDKNPLVRKSKGIDGPSGIRCCRRQIAKPRNFLTMHQLTENHLLVKGYERKRFGVLADRGLPVDDEEEAECRKELLRQISEYKNYPNPREFKNSPVEEFKPGVPQGVCMMRRQMLVYCKVCDWRDQLGHSLVSHFLSPEHHEKLIHFIANQELKKEEQKYVEAKKRSEEKAEHKKKAAVVKEQQVKRGGGERMEEEGVDAEISAELEKKLLGEDEAMQF